MGSLARSAGGLVGIGPGSEAPGVGVQGQNNSLGTLNSQNGLYANQALVGNLGEYARGNVSGNAIIDDAIRGTSPEMATEFMNALATGPTTGSRFATEQVQNNPVLGQLFGDKGLLSSEISKEQKLQNQGFQLTPEDQSMYGQMSGDIARQFGQQGNQLSNSLAQRGLASAPSGAAGALFSGLAGNQNEMLAKAQQQIMQNRFQNTMQQIGQQQQFINSLGGQANTAIQDQYGRQLQGAQSQRGALESAANLTNQANQGMNAANLGAAQFSQDNKPQNAFDIAIGGLAAAAGASGKAGGQKAGSSMFGQAPTPGQAPPTPPPAAAAAM